MWINNTRDHEIDWLRHESICNSTLRQFLYGFKDTEYVILLQTFTISPAEGTAVVVTLQHFGQVLWNTESDDAYRSWPVYCLPMPVDLLTHRPAQDNWCRVTEEWIFAMTAGLVALAVLATIVAVGIWAVPLLGPSAPAATVADRKPLTDRIPAPFVRPRLGNKGVHCVNGNVNVSLNPGLVTGNVRLACVTSLWNATRNDFNVTRVIHGHIWKPCQKPSVLPIWITLDCQWLNKTGTASSVNYQCSVTRSFHLQNYF